MMIGASAWGSYSDAKGRIPAFNGTLLLAAIFGSLLGFANSFLVLCILVICLGAGIGGSMPTDVSVVLSFNSTTAITQHFLQPLLGHFVSRKHTQKAPLSPHRFVGLVRLPGLHRAQKNLL